MSKALRRILTRQLATLTEEGEAYRTKLVLLAERRARAAREGHARSQADVTTRRQRKVAAGGGAAATTVVELDTQSAAGNPTYLAVEQRSDEFAAKLLGLDDRPALSVGARPPALDSATASVRLLGHLSSDTLERAHAELTRPPFDNLSVTLADLDEVVDEEFFADQAQAARAEAEPFGAERSLPPDDRGHRQR